MKAKVQHLILVVFIVAFGTVSFTDPEPYLVRRISDANFRYEFYTSDKKVTAKKEKTYFWFKGGAVHQAESGVGGLLLHGKFTKTFHSNQLAEQGEFDNGLKKGTWKTWYPNGKLETTQYWLDGIRKGTYVRYSQAGEILESGRYRNDKRHGQWIDHAKNDTVAYKKGVVFVKKPKLTKEEKAKLKEENAKLKEEKKKTQEIEKLAKKEEKERKSKERENKKLLKEQQKLQQKLPSEKAEKPGFFKRIFAKKEKQQ